MQKTEPQQKVSRFRIKQIILILSFFFSSVSLVNAAENVCLLPVLNLLLNSGNKPCIINYIDDDPKYDIVYKGLNYYRPEMPHTEYVLEQFSDSDFNKLSLADRRKVADKLLATLFYGYPPHALQEKITSGNFLCSIRQGMRNETNNMVFVEEEIRNDDHYYHSNWSPNEIFDILARFYVMEDLDKNFLHNWISYILTQTIMFSPAYELDSSHYPNVASVYNWLVFDMNDDVGMRYSTYLHMASSDNWRRFRSPEDNGREMLEIYTFDFDDTNVPKSAKTLQNWYLDDDNDTLVIGLNQNTIAQDLFGTTVTTGFDFYRELVKSDGFISGSVQRLVDFFFTDNDSTSKAQITDQIIASNPETWQDILLQIVFSKEFLLHTSRAKSAEELLYSLVRKLEYKHNKYGPYYFHYALIDMNQASMKYKLGKLERTPLDTLSFANYHQYIRETILRKSVSCWEDYENNYEEWWAFGWRPQLLGDDRFLFLITDPETTLTSFVSYLFELLIQRLPTNEELEMFKTHMLNEARDDYAGWSSDLDGFSDGCRYYGREYAARAIMDYISRLSELYTFQEVQ